MKNIVRVMVLVTAFMLVGTGAMAAEFLMAYRATTIDEAGAEIGTLLQGDVFSVTAYIENYREFTTYGEVKFSVKGKGVSGKDYWPDIEFNSQGVWWVWYEFPMPTFDLPEGVYTATFQFREMVKGAKWQKLICRFQIIQGTQGLEKQANDSGSGSKEGLQFKRMVGKIDQ